MRFAKTQSWTRLLWCVPLLGGLLGCVPESKHPVTKASESDVDSRLLGTWTLTTENGERHFIHIGRETETPIDGSRSEPEAGLMRFTMLVFDKDHGLQAPISGRFFVSRVDELELVNLVVPFEIASDVEQGYGPGYWICRYEVDDDRLRFSGMDFKRAAGAVEQGLIDGQVDRRGDSLQRVQIFSTSEELRKFLATDAGKELFRFPPPSEYTRLR